MPSNFSNKAGVRSGPSITPRNLFCTNSVGLRKFLASSILLSAVATRDVGQAAAGNPTSLLRAGLILGKVTATGNYANAIYGLVKTAYNGSTSLTVDANVATEIVRRKGATGTLKLTGPSTAGGTVRTETLTYSAINTTTGVITVTAVGSTADDEAITVVQTTAGAAAVSAVADVQTFTAAAGTDGGAFRFSYRGLATAELAWNVSTADAQTALRALHADLAAAAVTSVGGAGVDYVVTTAGAALSA